MTVRKYKYLLVLVGMLVVVSCGIRPEYQRPDLQLPDKFAGATAADTASIANISWRNFFTDKNLQSLIDKGLNYNYDLQIALKHIAVARQQMKNAKYVEIPTVDFMATYQIDRASDNSLNGITAHDFLGTSYIEDYNAQVAISWEADIWGKLSMQKQMAMTQYLQSGEAALAVQTRLISDIANGYYNLAMLNKQLEIAHNNLSLADTTLLLAQLQKDAGNATNLAVEQAEAQRLATARLVPELEQSIAIQQHALNILTGEFPGSSVISVEQDGDIPDALSSGVPAIMVERRPDIRAVELNLIVANKNVGITKMQMYPALNITAAGGINSFKSSNWFNIPASLFGLATGGIVQPILEHRTLKTKYKIAQVQREEAVLQFRQSVLNAVGEVSDALVSADKLKEQQQILEHRVNTLHKSVADAQLLFKSGMATYLEVITAQSDVLQAELDLALVQKQRKITVVDLYRSLGGGRN